MKKLSRIMVFTCLALLSCGKPDINMLRVTNPLPDGVLPTDASIILAFSRGVVPPESTNVWLTTPYLSFSPEVPGKFVWQDTARLMFSPDAPLPGDVVFKGKLNASLLTALAHAKGFDGPEEFTFRTPRFTMQKAEFFFDRVGEKRTVGIKANLEFTYEVNPQDVQSAMKITLDGQALTTARVTSTTRAKVIPVEIATVTEFNKDRDLTVTMDEGLQSPETNTHIYMERPFVYRLKSLAELEIHGHEFGFDGQTGWIRVRTSQEIDEAGVKAGVRVEPSPQYAIQPDQGGFTLRGKFEPGTSYHLTIAKGFESVLGGRTQNVYEADILIGNIQPTFRFSSSGGCYMLMSGRKEIEFKTTNMPKLAVRVSQIFQNNLVYFLDEGRYYDYYYDEGEEGEGGYSRKYRFVMRNYGRQLSYDTLSISGRANQEVSTPFSLEPFLKNDYKGFYLVEIANPAESWRTTGKLISISDIGLIVKRSSDEVQVFATSLATTRPLKNVRINLISTSNQVMMTANTDGDGVARFAQFQNSSHGFDLKLVTAELEEDFNFINLGDYRVETSRYEVEGKRDVGRAYDAMLYGDRNIYRPGEIMRVSAIVRNIAQPLPAHMPVRIRIANPQGTTVSDQQLVLNDEGSCETSYQTQAGALTGEYSITLSTANNMFLASQEVSVEEFVPDRLRISLTSSQPVAQPGEQIKFRFQALNFFGPPAAGRNWEFEGAFEHVQYVSKRFPDFRFADDAAKNYQANPDVRTGTTDANGEGEVGVDLPDELPASGIVRLRGRVGVFDESGRPVYQFNRVTVFPRPYFIGLNRLAYYVSPNTPQHIQVVAVDTADRPIKGFRAKIELIRLEWHSVLRQHQGTGALRYVSELRELSEHTDTLTLGAEPTEYTFMTPRSGEYRLRVSKARETGYNQIGFYSYSWGTSDITSFEVDPEARVEMVFDKPKYAPGEKAKVLFRTPFSGTMLVTVERNRVYTHQFVEVKDNAASLELPVQEQYLPNVYVAAVLFRKITDQNIPLLAGHGFAPLLVEKTSNKLDVVIKAPEKIRPKTTQTVTVMTGGEKDVYVTLAAVDEGICQVKNYRTPDPYGYFYGKKALETMTHDFFRDLLPEMRSDQSSVGGGEAEMAQRTNPLGVQRFRPVALWSGILHTNGDGEVAVPLVIPEFNGELRLMALAYKGDRFGSAQKAMKVADPVIITPALPRFLSPNDSLVMPITAFNTTDKATSLTLQVVTSGGITAPVKSVTLDVGPNQERSVDVGLRANDEIGKATVTVKTKAFGEEVSTTTELPVRPTAPYAAEGISGMVQGGGTASFDVTDAYFAASRKSYMTLSPYPVANFAKELKWLLGYPHGCLEQTVSKAFPQVYLRDIASILAPSAIAGGSPTYFVNEAITKLSSMQLPDGAFMYWPGEGGPASPWTTVYATHFLVEAKRAGYAVQESMLKSALQAVAQIARSKKTEDYYFYQANKVTVKRIADKSAVYAIYTLALAGIPEKSLMEFYRIEQGLLTNDTRFLLAGAYALSGDRKSFLSLLPAKFVPEEPQRTSGWNFDSPIRANALVLNVLLETDLNNPDIPMYLEYLSKQFRASYWYSTQDDAFTLLAFGKAARIAATSKVEGKVVVGGKELAYAGGTKRLDFDAFGKKVNLVVRGDGRVYYTLVTEGIRTDGKVKIEDKNLQVRREFLDRTGNSISSFRRNDLIVVRVTLISSVDRLENVAISDLLPAGLEIENPRLTEGTQYAFIKNASVPQYVDIRDDRINFYTSFQGSGRQVVYYYAVRAVSPGVFDLAPITAEAMYDANYYSASGGGRIRISK